MSAKIILALALTAAGMVASGPAMAQTQPDGSGQASAPIEEVTVTARRREEQIQTVPISIIALSGEALAARGIRNLSDVALMAPGLFAAPASTRGSQSPAYSIRAIMNRDPSMTNDPSVGIYFADVPWARDAGTNASLVDLESVQVLEGPQGTLFGRNSDGGAILITPKAPTDSFEGYAKVTGGDYGLFGIEGVVNLPISDTLALRLVGQHRQRNGYLTAVNSGQVLDDVNNESFRASAKWTPTDSFSSTFVGSYYHSDTNGDGLKLIGITPFALPGPAGLLRSSEVAALAATQALGKYQFLTSFVPGVTVLVPGGVNSPATSQYAHATTFSLQDTSQYSAGELGFLGDVTLKNIFGYRSVKEASSFETIGMPVLNIQVPDTFQNVSQVTEEAQLLGNNGPVEYVVGFFYFRESGTDGSNSFQLNTNAVDYDGYGVNTSYSVYGHMNIDLSSMVLDGLSLTGGVRLNWDEKEFTYKALKQSSAVKYTCVPQGTIITTLDVDKCAFPRSVSFEEPTWEVGLNYKATPNSMFYATISHGYRAGGFNTTPSTIISTNPFLSETIDNYEVGTKNDFAIGDMPVRLNLTAYYDNYSDVQRTINQVVNGVLNNLTINAARAHIEGTELEFTIKPTPQLEATASYAYTQPSYDNFTDIIADHGVDYPIDVSDSQFILVSKNTFNINLRYTLPVDDRFGTPSFSAFYYYRSGFYTTSDINTAHCFAPTDPNVPPALYVNCLNHAGKLPGYGLLNLRADWLNVMGWGFDASIFVDNVTDKYYFNSANNSYSSLGALSAFVGPPRMFGVELNVPFGASAY